MEILCLIILSPLTKPISAFLIPPYRKTATLFFLIFFKNTYPAKHEMASVIGNAHQINETPS